MRIPQNINTILNVLNFSSGVRLDYEKDKVNFRLSPNVYNSEEGFLDDIKIILPDKEGEYLKLEFNFMAHNERISYEYASEVMNQITNRLHFQIEDYQEFDGNWTFYLELDLVFKMEDEIFHSTCWLLKRLGLLDENCASLPIKEALKIRPEDKLTFIEMLEAL